MDVKKAYNSWAEQYDTNENKTRDVEALALKTTLSNFVFSNCLEIGCGTGKNTAWLHTIANKITAIDLSEDMLAKAKVKIQSDHVHFAIADITKDWDFVNHQYDLVTFSLMLEHIEDLDAIFKKLANTVQVDGYVYIGELHPFKQYTGSKARFETENGLEIVTCFNHHISDFTNAATDNGFAIVNINEFFDNDDRNQIPRILTLLLQKI